MVVDSNPIMTLISLGSYRFMAQILMERNS